MSIFAVLFCQPMSSPGVESPHHIIPHPVNHGTNMD